MRSYVTKGIVLNRTDFGEADRIITFLTIDNGKVKAMAKGVRKAKAKLAGSVELFSVSDLTLIPGKRDIDTLISARLVKHYGQIVKDIARTKTAYEILKLTDRATEDQPEPEYYKLLRNGLAALNEGIDSELVDLWFRMQLLKLSGHSPNLQTDRHGVKLEPQRTYDFHIDEMHFTAELAEKGAYTASHIKFLRLGFASASPRTLQRVKGGHNLAKAVEPLIATMLTTYIRD